MRADPDVILVGEMRDRATMEAVLSAAETGHLVLSTLHTNDAPQAVDRIVDAFSSGAQGQVRTQLAATLLAVVSLRLVARQSGAGRIAAAEILIATDAVRTMIRDGKRTNCETRSPPVARPACERSKSSLSDYVTAGTVSLDSARLAANRPAESGASRVSAG